MPPTAATLPLNLPKPRSLWVYGKELEFLILKAKVSVLFQWGPVQPQPPDLDRSENVLTRSHTEFMASEFRLPSETAASGISFQFPRLLS